MLEDWPSRLRIPRINPTPFISWKNSSKRSGRKSGRKRHCAAWVTDGPSCSITSPTSTPATSMICSTKTTPAGTSSSTTKHTIQPPRKASAESASQKLSSSSIPVGTAFVGIAGSITSESATTIETSMSCSHCASRKDATTAPTITSWLRYGTMMQPCAQPLSDCFVSNTASRASGWSCALINPAAKLSTWIQ